MMKWTEFRKLKVWELNSLSVLLSGGQMNTSLERSRIVGHRCTAAHTLTQKHTFAETLRAPPCIFWRCTSLSVVTCWDRHTHTRRVRTHTHFWSENLLLFCNFIFLRKAFSASNEQAKRISRSEGVWAAKIGPNISIFIGTLEPLCDMHWCSATLVHALSLWISVNVFE